MDNPILQKLGMLSNKMSANHVLQGISKGVMGVLPVIIVGAFASLFLGLPVEAWQGLIASTGLSGALAAVVAATTSMLGLYITFSVARAYGDELGVDAKILGVLAAMLYFVLMPTGQTEELGSFVPFTYLGTQGMIIGIIIAILTVHVYKFVVDKNIVIKMPEGTPPFVSNSFVALIPGFIVVALGIVLRLLFAATPFGSAFDFVYAVLQAPLTALVGENIWSLVVLNAIAGLIFAFGIHSGFITGMIAPILFGLDAMNQAAYAAGDPVPSVIGMAFSYITTVAVFYPAMAASVLIGAKSERMRTVGKLGLAPAIFGISEPLVFGLPIVFNPVLIVPYLVIPAVNQLVAYALMSAGIVARCSGVTVFNIPMIATGLMNGSLSIALMEIALFALDVVMLLPFIKVQDKQYLAEEQAANSGE